MERYISFFFVKVEIGMEWNMNGMEWKEMPFFRPMVKSHSSSVLDLGFVYSIFSELCNILVRKVLVRNIKKTFKLHFFNFKANSLVLYTKFCDSQFFLVCPDFLDFFSKNLELSQIFLVPPDFFSNFS